MAYFDRGPAKTSLLRGPAITSFPLRILRNGTDARVVIRRVAPRYSLEDLLERVTPENLHLDIDAGPRLGREEW